MNKMKSLYLHFPFCQHLCNYCDFYKHKLLDQEQVNDFERLLLEQIVYHKNFLEEQGLELAELDTIYIGGGTPSLWKGRGVHFLKGFFRDNNITLSDNVEFTIEVDPDTWTESEIDEWLSLGVNRFSIGSQAFTSELLKVMDRTHVLADVERTLKFMHDRALNFSVDLMLGLPNSNTRDIEDELSRILSYEPNHLSIYILKARKKYPLIDQLPKDERIRDEYLRVSRFLTGRGYEHYEVSNFAKNKCYSRHNLKYWEYQSVGALGSNATGLIVRKNKALRYHWKSKSVGIVTEEIAGDSLIVEKLFLGLRNFRGIDLKTLFPAKDFTDEITELYSSWMRQGYLTEASSEQWFQLTALGYLMSDSLMDDIFKKIDF